MNEHQEPTSPTTPRPLQRRRNGRILGGVAGGLADAAGVDPVLVRIGFAALTFVGGIGLLAYLVLWALVPDREGGEAVAETALRRLSTAPPAVRITLLVIAVWFALAALGPVSGSGVFVLFVVLVVVLLRAVRPSAQA
jgi:phage shock protein PspC (stress-responsive transcriptional regulator)